MSDLNKKYQNIMRLLEENIKDKNKLNTIKAEFSDLIIYFSDMVNKSAIIESDIIKVDNNIKKLQKRIDLIENDIYVDSESESELEELGYDQMHDNDYEFEITCPYCNFEFLTDSSYENEKKITCPRCNKTIELDWNNTDSCNFDCSSCKSKCYEEDNDDDREEKVIADNDTDYKVEVNLPKDENNENNNNKKDIKDKKNKKDKNDNNDNNENEDDM